jgi:Spy/CpxP family protein refolding chaperone
MSLRLLPLLVTASILVPMGSNIVFAQQEPPPPPTENNQAPPPPNGNPEPPWVKDLNLSDQQKEQIKTIHNQEIQETESLREQLTAAEQQLRSLFGSDASTAELQQQHHQIQKLQQKLDDRHFETILAERQILTPEQRAQLANLKPPQQRP